MESSSLFASLERVSSRYRQGVFRWSEGATPEALRSLEVHIGRPLPKGLVAFLSKHNGADLFRGSVRIRGTSDVAFADLTAPQVILFADGPDEALWGWAVGRDGSPVFGLWTGHHLEPVAATFEAWLRGTLAVVEARAVRMEDQITIRLESTPDDPWLQARVGTHLLERGKTQQAIERLRHAVKVYPNHVRAWQKLGDALSMGDARGAREAWLEAFRRSHLPLTWPGAPGLGEDLLGSLAASVSEARSWEKELERFLEDRVTDVRTAYGVRLLEEVSCRYAKSLISRGLRRQARALLSDGVSRLEVSSWGRPSWKSLLMLARIEMDLGNHDEVEQIVRRVVHQGSLDERAQAFLLLAELVITRQEPWAEDVLEEAGREGLSETGRLYWMLLRAERAVRQERLEEARTVLMDAQQLSAHLGAPALDAWLNLVAGDVAMLDGRTKEARAAWRRGLDTLGDRKVEVGHRMELRLGDLALKQGDDKAAYAWYARAVEGYAVADLPVREGWTLLRLGRLCARTGDEGAGQAHLEAAYKRFTEADLAAGVAAVDAAMGQSGRSLAWHLERASAHAKARHDAQRARPPWNRSDADRPERRLGAHRLAIAACDVEVVRALKTEMEACARAISVGRGRPTDAPVLRYTASVDLLGGHRSFEAAEVLLKHLIDRTLEGSAYRSLLGAVARSPNAALVDGLLRVIETPAKFTGPAVATSCEVLGLRRERASVGELQELVGPDANIKVRHAAVVALGRIGERGSIPVLVESLKEPRLAEPAALALLMLGDPQGLHFHREALAQGRTDLSGHPGEIVGRYGGPENLILLRTVAEAGGEMGLGALVGLGLLGDPRGVQTLLEYLKSRDTRSFEVAASALEVLTGHHEDVEEPGARQRWDDWWVAHAERFALGVRHRAGVPMDAGWLISRMEDVDPYTRRTAYDELVITTGVSLPFDAEGPWRLQQAHLREWRAWWQANQSRFPAGSWYLDGQGVS
jgi:HEAT repeat protein/tetratricopeptide (TPR) repeat protein